MITPRVMALPGFHLSRKPSIVPYKFDNCKKIYKN